MTDASHMSERIRSAFQELIKFDPHPFQLRVIKPIMRKKPVSVFGVMSTGAGKSMTFQVPAHILGGLTVVFSPLISLMKDQVDSCNQMGIPAARITHDVSREEVSRIYKNLERYRILYVAPERLKNAKFLEKMRSADLKLIALDEVHEHSKSGKDFRPAYSMVADFIARFPRVPVVALTATADEEVEREFMRAMGGRDYYRVVASPNRSNLHYHIVQEQMPRSIADLLAPIEESGGSSIVYATTRTVCDNVCALLRRYGRNAEVYHGGMRGADRHAVQERWMSGQTPTVVATNAFGMGVNKANVRLVYHYAHPGSVFAYLQEAGRAGRDGLDSDCYLNISNDGTRTQQYFIDIQNPDMLVYERLWDFLRTKREPLVHTTLERLMKVCELRRGMGDQALSALRFMEYYGCVDTSPGNTKYVLPVINREAANRYARRFRYVKINQRIANVVVPPNMPDPVAEMVDDRAVGFALPTKFIKIRRTAPGLIVNEDHVREKKQKAYERLAQIFQFARAVDKAAFIDDIFLRRADEDIAVTAEE